MSKNTPNYNLEKPNQDDFYNVDVQNRNMDIIDTTLKTLDNKIADGVTHEDINGINNKLDAINNGVAEINTKSDQIKQNTETIKNTTNATKTVVDNTKSTVDSTKTKVDAIDTRTNTMVTNINTLLNGRTVKSVQRGTALMPQGGSSVIINFTSVDTSKCSVKVEGMESRLYLSSFTATSMKLLISYDGTSGFPAFVSWEIVEYY